MRGREGEREAMFFMGNAPTMLISSKTFAMKRSVLADFLVLSDNIELPRL